MKHRMIFGALAAALTVGGTAAAGSFDEARAACAAALAAEAGVEAADYDARLLKARGGRSQRVTVELNAAGKPDVVGECKVRRGEVLEVELTA